MKYGEIIELGRHRLMCGDATKIEDLNALLDGAKVDWVLTDPPYGMKCQDKNGRIGSNLKDNGYMYRFIPSKEYPLLIGDNNSDNARYFYENIKHLSATKIIWGGNYFADFLPVSGAWLFWNKRTGSSDFSDGELAWISNGKRIRYYEQLWCGCNRQGKRVLEGYSRVHPTQKPVELHAHILEDFSKTGAIVLDAFGGSGTTLIACEITNRTCYMMEISPDYCEIIRERYKKVKREYMI